MNTIETMAAMRTPLGESPKGIHYALAKLGESARAARHAAAEMPRLRERARKHGDADDAEKAREALAGLEAAARRLAPALETAALALMEAGLENGR